MISLPQICVRKVHISFQILSRILSNCSSVHCFLPLVQQFLCCFDCRMLRWWRIVAERFRRTYVWSLITSWTMISRRNPASTRRASYSGYHSSGEIQWTGQGCRLKLSQTLCTSFCTCGNIHVNTFHWLIGDASTKQVKMAKISNFETSTSCFCLLFSIFFRGCYMVQCPISQVITLSTYIYLNIIHSFQW